MKKMIEVLKNYSFYDKNIEYEKFGNGNINKTYYIKKDGGYIIQEINSSVFTNPEDIIDNINKLNEYKDNNRCEIELIKLVKNIKGDFITIIEGEKKKYYRCYKYIESKVHSMNHFDLNMIYEGGKIIGRFLKEFDGFDYKSLNVIIPNFHNTKLRYKQFINEMKQNKYFRKKLCLIECGYLIKNYNLVENIDEYIRYFKLRVCHNDTKLSNVLFDKDNKAIALIDIDTIMPGYLIFDYSDGARSCISSLKEDDINYDDLKIDLNKFYMFTKGFLESTISIITNEEIECLVDSIIVITYECALRFLTDFLNNDNYFKTNYCYHNLIRTRNQIKLIEELKNKKNILKNIVNELILEIKK